MKNIIVDRSDIMAILAIIVSMGAMFISLRQTSILKEQQEIMFAQQNIMSSQMEGSVWPHIKINMDISDKGILKYAIINKGVGPARIDYFDLFIKDQKITDVVKLFNILTEEGITTTSFKCAIPNDVVLAPNETHEILKLETDETSIYKLVKLFGEHKICYKSIYDKMYGDCTE